jgi:bifunctional DNA-binding transcriptional regulator/antitoxin component of YhaV-PrlF toxin-antitoxin module
VIPVELRRELGLEPGETLIARVESRRLVLERGGEILARLRSELREATPSGTSVVDELLAERRRDARREAAELERA